MLIPSEKSNFSVSDLPKDYNFNGLDLMKFICAYLVCTIHIRLFYSNTPFSEIMAFYLPNWIGRIAVPFYFTTSGFLLFKKLELTSPDFGVIKRYCFKNLRLLGTWAFLLLVGGTGHMWYIGASLFAIVLLGMLFKINIKTAHILLISVILYIIGLLGDAYYGFLIPLTHNRITNDIVESYFYIFRMTRNGVFFGFIFVMMGALFAHKKIIINNVLAILGLLISLVFLLMELYLLHNYSTPKDCNMFIFLVPTVFFLFYIASHIKLANRPVFKKMRIWSVLIYFIHPLIAYFMDDFVSVLAAYGLDFIRFKFVIIVLTVTLFAIIIERLSHRKNFRWLRYLYS